MTKFRILKIKTLNDSFHYEIQEKSFIWWNTIVRRIHHYGYVHVEDSFEPLQFASEQEAETKIKSIINARKNEYEDRLKAKRLKKENSSKKSIVKILEFKL